uniref:Uncharacterized protein n=1 Tax=Arundo donax TaxID=35708 RepID=A0A0A9H1X9_ARUDO
MVNIVQISRNTTLNLWLNAWSIYIPTLFFSLAASNGNFCTNRMKPSANTIFLKFFSIAKKSMHLPFNSQQLYVLAQAKVEANVSIEMLSHSLRAHIRFSLFNA